MIAAMITASMVWPTTAETTLASSKMITKGLPQNRITSNTAAERTGAGSFRPYFLMRSAAGAAGRPDPKPEKYAGHKLREGLTVWSSAAALRRARECRRRATARSRSCGALRQAESGTKVSEICREHGISDATFYIWKKYAGLGLIELRELRQLRDENAKLKRLVADLSLDRHILQEIVQIKLQSPSAARTRHRTQSGVRARWAPSGGAGEDHKGGG
jgi:putative transposase